jgi:GNAT superfamily N-acetyltransferase
MDDFTISSDPSKLDVQLIHSFLTNSYWARNIPLPVVQAAIENSLCFGVYHHDKQVGFARVITDYATFAYLADVFIVEDYRGRALSKWLIQTILAHPNLQGLRRWLLATRDAHTLYSQFGFGPLKAPERWMDLHDPDVYSRP